MGHLQNNVVGLAAWVFLGVAMTAAGAISLGGCGDSQACGAGTDERAGECVASGPTCGAGTVLDGGICAPADTTDPGDTSVGDAIETGSGDTGSGAPDVDAIGGGVPSAWFCEAWRYGDGVTCECGCGAGDPDCEHPEVPVIGCPDGTCQPDGTCGPCTPDCDGRVCDGDGCGGSCGDCLAPGLPYCHDGMCTANCIPECADRDCGSDGCGDLCGVCDPGDTCSFGTCQPLPEALSCVGYCDGVAPSGCACDSDCIPGFTCCSDRQAACGGSP
ncbi:MAG: hypothetical protein ACI9MR_001111 [Myxococcota bacterium]|jgi:hypothetical protein